MIINFYLTQLSMNYIINLFFTLLLSNYMKLNNNILQNIFLLYIRNNVNMTHNYDEHSEISRLNVPGINDQSPWVN